MCVYIYIYIYIYIYEDAPRGAAGAEAGRHVPWAYCHYYYYYYHYYYYYYYYYYILLSLLLQLLLLVVKLLLLLLILLLLLLVGCTRPGPWGGLWDVLTKKSGRAHEVHAEPALRSMLRLSLVRYHTII